MPFLWGFSLYQVGIQKAWATSEDAPVDIDAKNAILDEGTTMADAILGKDNYHRLDLSVCWLKPIMI
ncbi:MAG: hypothetical protein IPJ71_19230 [Bdellovibrionales bacterium]|nr:hypothetical protein [Bdellovibrionales bacterium]